MDDNKIQKIFFKLEKLLENDSKIDLGFVQDDEKNEYIIGIASTPDKNNTKQKFEGRVSNGFITENRAMTDAWEYNKSQNKPIAVYEKHGLAVGKVILCKEMSGKVLIAMEIPKAGNERLLSVYDQGVYMGLSIGGFALDGFWDMNEIFHVTEFEWLETSLTDIPSNENALLLEFAESKRIPIKKENKIESVALEKTLQQVIQKIKGN